uniref:DNA-directed RNA polymerase n=1 Tax=viral metagenome TaxID=1070528 RepID=A0A6C0FC32_9ZZZZ|tara:strand:- start:512 stop:4072 length:3561 start_codon:yes stop_codon:yes gene_type:complete
MATNMDNTEKNMKKKYDNISWKIIESYFKDKYLTRLVRHQLESYNYFIEKQLFDTIKMFNPVKIHSEKEKEETGQYLIDIIINFANLKILRPQIHENNGATKIMFPHEARLRNFTYSSQITIDLNIKILRKSGKDFKKIETIFKNIPSIHIGKIPIMLKSNICVLKQFSHYNSDITKECDHDPGGYFIISGSEKTILAQERAAENNVMCFNIKKNNNKWSWLAEIKSIPLDKCISPKQINVTIATRNYGNGHNIDISIPRIKQPIPIFILFRALGVISDKEITNYILLDNNAKELKQMLFGLKASIISANKYTTQEECFDYIVNYVMYTPIKMTKEIGEIKKREFTKGVLENDLFPHCPSKTEKIYFLGYMINKLLKTSFGWRKPDDRDSYSNKRLDLAGSLINNLFRNYFNKLVKDMQKQIIREINNGSWQSTDNVRNIINQTNIYKIIKSTTIENGIKRALATGDFGIKNTNSQKVGVAQVLNRLTYISTLSHLRRINTPIDKSGKLIPPRKLHNTQWGFICPAETPEGQSVGVVKNISYLTHITIKSEIEPILNILKDKIIKLDEEITFDKLFNKVKVFVNGCWVGIAKKPMHLFKKLKYYKYTGIFNIYTSITFNIKNKEIFICNDAGRLCRPLFKVKKNKLLINKKMEKYINNNCDWDELCVNHAVKESIIEYIDSAEQNNSLIAIKPSKLKSDEKIYYNFTHCEIHPSTIFGILASCIPFPEHNQSPRNTYQCAMGKQAMGTYTTNFQERMDKTAYVQTYTMRPLVDTRLMNIIKLNQIPSGSMVIVAIMTYSGYNQEDSIIFNEGSIKRGLFSATIYKTEKDEDKNIHGDEEIRCKADKTRTKGIKFANYDKLNENGIIPENTLIENRDIIIGKVVPIKENRNDPTKLIKYKDYSKIYRTNESCFVDKNYINRNGDGYTFAKIRTRTYRIPDIGDKFSSRHGQKGTIGLILKEKDVPFTAQGLKPDIIINPHCIPSRMTMAQLKETLLGKVLLELGLFGDGTSFGEYPIKDICENLQKLNYEKHGEEILYNGMTGEQLETSIFIGPVFYQRLKHMVRDKVHSRNIGPMVVLTRQPQEGRSRDGGLRFGEMERDCMISHGAAGMVYDRTYQCSDKFEVYVCDYCGLIAIYNDKKNIYNCKTCDNFVSFSRVKIPYACKLLFQELTTMNAVPRIITNNSFK